MNWHSCLEDPLSVCDIQIGSGFNSATPLLLRIKSLLGLDRHYKYNYGLWKAVQRYIGT